MRDLTAGSGKLRAARVQINVWFAPARAAASARLDYAGTERALLRLPVLDTQGPAAGVGRSGGLAAAFGWASAVLGTAEGSEQ